MSTESHLFSNPAAEARKRSQGAPTSLNVLVVDDETNIRKVLATSLEIDGHRVVTVRSSQDAIDQAGRNSFDLAFVDLRLGQTLGSDLIPAHGSIDSAVETMRRGAADYLTKPFTPAQVRLVIQRILQFRVLEQKIAGLEGTQADLKTVVNLQSNSSAMQRVIRDAHQLAMSRTSILLRGESGTGKGALARAIHAWSDRAARPFATVSCPTLSSQLLESELFGHAKGAFTGAVRDNPGRIAACEGGTLFLDEVGDLPRELQPKLLRFVQDREYERVGDQVTRHADVRIITATNIDLEQAVKAGTFREDLLYRIKVIQIDLPPLRERPEDIADLSDRFLAEFRGGRPIEGFTAEARLVLQNCSWPGNIRELRNVIERAVILCRAGLIGVEHLPSNFKPRENHVNLGDRVSLNRLEELHIRRILASTESLDQAANVLGIDVATLWRRRKKYGM